MGAEWYDLIAKRNGGYLNSANFTIEGISGETIFEEKLRELFSLYPVALDAGCGHGDFTLRMASYATSIVGIDFSLEMIKIANQLLSNSTIKNVEFIHATTKHELHFEDNHFDMIYDRRGPTSILNHSRILRPGGIVFGIHSAARDIVEERLRVNCFIDIEIEEFSDAIFRFKDETELMKFMSDIPGNPDYSLSVHHEEFKQLVNRFVCNDGYVIPEWKYISKAKKPE